MKTSQFSRRTIIAAFEVLEGMNQAELTRFVLKLGPDYARWVAGESLSVAKRINSLISLYDERPDRLTDGDHLFTNIVVETAVVRLPASVWQAGSAGSAHPLIRSLALDGFRCQEGTLRPAMPGRFGFANVDDEITTLLKAVGLAIPQGHLNQALAAHARGDWAAANGQIRTFFDALLDEFCARIDPSATSLPSGQARRARLASKEFLAKDLNEWADDGKGYVNGLVKRLHPHGAHPGLSDEEDSTFRLHTVLLTARLLLLRFVRLHEQLPQR